MAKLYKVLSEGGKSCHGGSYKWDMPVDGKPGAWATPVDDIKPCERGYHLCKAKDLIYWLGDEIWEAEGRGTWMSSEYKVVYESARLIRKVEAWNERTARLFACDCAEGVLYIWENRLPDETSIRNAIEIARKYANGEATAAALHDANVNAEHSHLRYSASKLRYASLAAMDACSRYASSNDAASSASMASACDCSLKMGSRNAVSYVRKHEMEKHADVLTKMLNIN